MQLLWLILVLLALWLTFGYRFLLCSHSYEVWEQVILELSYNFLEELEINQMKGAVSALNISTVQSLQFFVYN